MAIGKFVLLLIAAALCIQALTNEADLAEMVSKGGGGFVSTGSMNPFITPPPPRPPELLPGQCHKGTPAGTPREHISYGCKTCSSNQTTRSYEPKPSSGAGGPRDPKLGEQCTSCGTAKSRVVVARTEVVVEHDLFLVAKKFTVHEGKHVVEGKCELLPKLEHFDPSQKSVCQDTPCTDGSTGSPIGSGGADKTVCSRLCLLGGALTRVTNLNRYDNPGKGTGKRLVGAKLSYNRLSEPVCGLHKTVMCTKNKDYDLVNCQKSGKSTHCKKQNCTVQKSVNCVAILPKKLSDSEMSKANMEKNPGSEPIGNDFMKKCQASACRPSVKPDPVYTNECKNAINPCELVALYV